MSDKQKEATSLIVEQLAQSGIKLVASLPDDWIAPLIDAVDKDDRFKHVPVNREESAIGLCSGAYFGGIPSLALMYWGLIPHWAADHWQSYDKRES